MLQIPKSTAGKLFDMWAYRKAPQNEEEEDDFVLEVHQHFVLAETPRNIILHI